jgi:hypothetical protein
MTLWRSPSKLTFDANRAEQARSARHVLAGEVSAGHGPCPLLEVFLPRQPLPVAAESDPLRPIASISCCISEGPFLSPALSRYGDGTAARLSAPGAVPHDVAHQVAHVVLQISDDVLDDVSDRDHAHDLARVQHW